MIMVLVETRPVRHPSVRPGTLLLPAIRTSSVHLRAAALQVMPAPATARRIQRAARAQRSTEVSADCLEQWFGDDALHPLQAFSAASRDIPGCGHLCQRPGGNRADLAGALTFYIRYDVSKRLQDGPYPFRYSPSISAFLITSLSLPSWPQLILGLDITPSCCIMPIMSM